MRLVNSLSVIKERVLSRFLPKTISGSMFATKAINESRTTWDTANYQLDNEINLSPPSEYAYMADFVAANSNYVTSPIPSSSYNTFQFWVYLNSTTEILIGFVGFAQRIHVVAGTITFDSLPGSVTTYVDGVETTTITAGAWHHVRMVSSLAIINNIHIGYDDNLNVYSTARFKDFSMSLNGVDYREFTPEQIIAEAVNCRVFYSLAEGFYSDGSIALDYSGNGNHGTWSGVWSGVKFAPHVGYVIKEDQRNRYIDFDGVDDTITLSTTITSGNSTTGYVEIDCILPNTPVNNFSRLAGNTINDWLGTFNTGGGRIAYYTSTGNDLTWAGASTIAAFDGKLHKLRFTIASGVMSLSIDGVDQGAPIGTNSGMYLWDLLTISYSSPAEAPIFRIDYNGTVIYPNENIAGVISGSPQYIEVHSVNGTTDLFGDTFNFTPVALPDAQMQSGGGIAFVSTNVNRVDFSNITLSGDFEIQFWAKNNGTSEAILGGATGTGSNNQIIFNSTTQISIRYNSTTINTWTVPNNTSWAHYRFKRNGSNVSLYVNDTLISTVSSASTASAVYGRLGESGANGDVEVSNLAIFDGSFDHDLYNNPNRFVELCRSHNAELIYDFCEGVYNDGSPVIDKSGNGNYGVFSGVGNAAIVNSSVGLQTLTHGFSIRGLVTGTGTISSSGTSVTGVGTAFTTQLAIGDFIQVGSRIVEVLSIASNTSLTLVTAPSSAFSGDNFNILDQDSSSTNIRILANSPKGTTDVFGSTVQYPWTEGLLNFEGLGGNVTCVVGSANNSLYFSKTTFTAFTVINFRDTAGFPQLWSNLRFGTSIGQRFSITGNGSGKFDLTNSDDTPTSIVLSTNANATHNKWHFVAISLSMGGLVKLYYGDLSSVMSLDKSGNVGARALTNENTRVMYFGRNIASNINSFPTVNGYLQNTFYAGELSLAELNKLRDYYIKIINKLP